MTIVKVSHTTSASPKTCWHYLSDFANIDVFNSNLSKSYLLNPDHKVGVGTLRQCDLTDGKNYLREKIIEWKEGEYYVIDIYESSFPMKRQATKFGLLPQTDGGTLIYMEFDYKVKFGPIGSLMDLLFLRNFLRKGLTKVVIGLGKKSEEKELKVQMAA